MKHYVFDASFVLAFLLHENLKAVSLAKKISHEVTRGQARVSSTNLLSLEVANALRFKLLESNEAAILYKKFSDLTISCQDFSTDQVLTIQQHAYQFNTTVYDTSYHFLAKFLDGIFVTCDADYFKRASAWGNIKLCS